MEESQPQNRRQAIDVKERFVNQYAELRGERFCPQRFWMRIDNKIDQMNLAYNNSGKYEFMMLL